MGYSYKEAAEEIALLLSNDSNTKMYIDKVYISGDSFGMIVLSYKHDDLYLSTLKIKKSGIYMDTSSEGELKIPYIKVRTVYSESFDNSNSTRYVFDCGETEVAIEIKQIGSR
jgi:homospermidine synthase